MSELFTTDEVLDHLAQECEAAGGQQAWARLHNLSPKYVCDALKRRRSLGQKLTKELGFKFVAMYETE